MEADRVGTPTILGDLRPGSPFLRQGRLFLAQGPDPGPGTRTVRCMALDRRTGNYDGRDGGGFWSFERDEEVDAFPGTTFVDAVRLVNGMPPAEVPHFDGEFYVPAGLDPSAEWPGRCGHVTFGRHWDMKTGRYEFVCFLCGAGVTGLVPESYKRD